MTEVVFSHMNPASAGKLFNAVFELSKVQRASPVRIKVIKHSIHLFDQILCVLKFFQCDRDGIQHTGDALLFALCFLSFFGNLLLTRHLSQELIEQDCYHHLHISGTS